MLKKALIASLICLGGLFSSSAAPTLGGPTLSATGGSTNSSSGGVDTNAVIALIEQYGGGGGVVSNSMGLTFSLETRYTNNTDYAYVSASAALTTTASASDTAAIAIKVDTDANGTYEYTAHQVAQQGRAATALSYTAELGAIVPPGAVFIYDGTVAASGGVDIPIGSGQIVYFSTNGASGGGGGGVSAAEVAAIMLTNMSATATSLVFSQTNSAWVSDSGNDATGQIGKIGLPFRYLTNAVTALRAALVGDARGVVYVSGTQQFATTCNLARTNNSGISIICDEGTVLSASANNELNTHGPAFIIGHNSVFICQGSNNPNASVKQALVGWDLTKAGALGTTLVPATNFFIKIKNVSPGPHGSSDLVYGYDEDSGASAFLGVIELDAMTKWDCIFFNSGTSDMPYLQIRNSNIEVRQPDGYTFPQLGSGAGRARAVFMNTGFLELVNSSVRVFGGNSTTNEATAVTCLGSEGWTNINSQLEVNANATSQQLFLGGMVSVGKQSPSVSTTNRAFSGSFIVATSEESAKATLDGSSLTNLTLISSLTSTNGFFTYSTNSTGRVTATFVLTNTITSTASSVKVYRALLAQSGSSAPTATILENSLGFTPTFGRSSGGVYTVNSTSGFPTTKTLVRFGLSSAATNPIGNYELATASQIILRVVDDSTIGSTADDVISTGTVLEILVYP